MNAAILAVRIPIVVAPPQESSKSTAPSAEPPASAPGARDFAGALDRASAKHSRKDDSAKSGAGKRSGGKLPPAGGNAPPAATPVAIAPTLPQLLGPSGAPVVFRLDEGDDAPDQAAASAVGATSAGATSAGATAASVTSAGATPAGATVAVISGAALSNVSAGADNSGTASEAGASPGVSGQGAPGLQSAALGAGGPVVDPTASGAATDDAAAGDGAGPTSAGADVPQSSDASAAASVSTAKLSAAQANGARAIATPVSVSKPQLIATGSEAAVSAAAGRAVAHAASPAGTSAPADDNATPAQPPLASTALINLALVEGSDATGSAASALQAANAAASSSAPAADAAAAAASPFTALQVPMTITAGAASATTLDTAALTAAAVVSLGSGGDARGHNGAGDSGPDTGSGSFANGGGAAALQQLSASTTSNSSAAAPVPTVSVHADVDSADFPQGVADKVSLAVDNGWSSAKLSVNPPQLGPIELQIAVQGAHAQIAMSTHSAVTREALESSVPTLRDMLNSQGFTNVSVDISQRSFQERSAPESPYGRTSGGTREAAPVSASSAQVSRAPLGMLDTYA